MVGQPPYASGCVGLIHCETMLEIFVIILDVQATTTTIRVEFWVTLSSMWIHLGQHFYTCHLLVGGPFGMVLNMFEICLTLRIQQVALFNSTDCVPMWLSAASLGLWLEFLGLVDFWL
jgi:hypothetical protein